MIAARDRCARHVSPIVVPKPEGAELRGVGAVFGKHARDLRQALRSFDERGHALPLGHGDAAAGEERERRGVVAARSRRLAAFERGDSLEKDLRHDDRCRTTRLLAVGRKQQRRLPRESLAQANRAAPDQYRQPLLDLVEGREL
jgi:hypothetical protein